MAEKIVFITPPYERIMPGYDFVRYITNKSPSLGLLHLAAMVREHGFEPSIIESDIFGLTQDEVVQRVISERPRYVGITLFTVGVWGAVAIARKIKEVLPETRVIVGGPHMSSMGPETMQRFTEFDLAVLGEGEKTLVELLACLESDGDLGEVAGILYRQGESVRQTSARISNVVLDDLPMPAWDLLPNFPHTYKPAIYDYPRGPVATIAASRGCPFHCKFCDTSTFGAKVLHYSPQVVFNMMKHLNEKYGVRHILFVDDLFLASRSRTMEICNLILEHKLKMTWSCAARVDTVKPELLTLMRKAGCWEISFGLETGSNELLQKMDKMARLEKAEQAVIWTSQARIRTKGLFMLGYPGENRQTIELTKAFIRRIPMHLMNLTKFTPYPGSPIYRELYGTSIRDDHWEKMNGMNFVWAPEGMEVEELDRAYQKVLMAFYGRVGVSSRLFWWSLRYPNHLSRLFRFLFGYFAAKCRSFIGGRKGLLIGQHETQLNPHT